MAITSIGYDGTVDETEFERVMGYSAHSKYGVNVADAFKASTVAGQVLQVKLSSAGGLATAWTFGLVDRMDADETVQLESPSDGTRWDMIVLRRNYQPPGGTTTLEVIKGSSRKAIPSRETDDGVLNDQPLWLVRVDSGKTTPVEYVDLRVWARNGGCTAKDELVRSFMFMVGTQIEINGTLWLRKIGTNNTEEWVKLVENDDTGWVDGSVAGSWNKGDGYLKCKMRNGLVEVRGRVIRNSTSTQYVAPNGDIQNRQIGAIPRKFAPAPGPVPALTSGVSGPIASYYVDPNGAVYIAAVAPGSTLDDSFSSTFSGFYFSD